MVTAEKNGQIDRGELVDVLVGEPLTAGYVPTLPAWSVETSNWIPQVYILRDIELMLTHPIVRSVLEFYRGGIATAEFAVECESPEAEKFIMDQCQLFWDRGIPQMHRGDEYGWLGLENMYKEDEHLFWDDFRHFSPRDTFLLTSERDPVGIRIKNVKPKGKVDLWLGTKQVPGKGTWYAHNPRYNQFYGQSQLLGAWRPWRRLAYKDALETSIDTGLYRFAFCGPQVGYPEEDMQVAPSAGSPYTTQDSQGNPRRFARDMARQIAEWAKTGAGIGFPTTKYPQDQGGGDKWTFKWPEHTINVDGLIAAARWLQEQICYGIGVPPELLAAAETGSGYSGRAIPMEAFINGQQKLADRMLLVFVNNVLKALVRWNFGQVKWKVKVRSLIETKRKAQTGQDPAQSQAEPTSKLTGEPVNNDARDRSAAPPVPDSMQPPTRRGFGGPASFSLSDREKTILEKILRAA